VRKLAHNVLMFITDMAKNTLIAIIGGTLLAGAAAQAGTVEAPTAPVAPAASGIAYELTVGAHTDYIFRGAKQAGGELADVAFSASTDVYGYAVTAGAWYGSTSGAGAIDELDLSLDISKDFFGVKASAGYIHYDFTGAAGGDSTAELYFGLAKEFYGFDFGATYYHDIDNFDGDGYLEATVGKAFDCPFTGLKPEVTVGAGYSFDASDFTHYFATVEVPYALTDSATVTPYVSASFADDALASDKEYLFGGVTLSVSF